MPAVMQSISGKAGRDLIRGSLNNCVAIGGQSWESRNLFEVITHIQ